VYSDAQAVALYDVLNPWQPSDDFYLSLMVGAASVLDLGCGTGTVLKAARTAGHTGRLVGVDPDRAALDVAQYGGWSGEALAGDSPEIVTEAVAA
jgi:SAM-dependent methyltransferase